MYRRHAVVRARNGGYVNVSGRATRKKCAKQRVWRGRFIEGVSRRGVTKTAAVTGNKKKKKTVNARGTKGGATRIL